MDRGETIIWFHLWLLQLFLMSLRLHDDLDAARNIAVSRHYVGSTKSHIKYMTSQLCWLWFIKTQIRCKTKRLRWRVAQERCNNVILYLPTAPKHSVSDPLHLVPKHVGSGLPLLFWKLLTGKVHTVIKINHQSSTLNIRMKNLTWTWK